MSDADRARIVAEHWRNEALNALQQGHREWGLVTHSLGLVIAAFDGETDPAQLGVPADHPDVEKIRKVSDE